MSQGKCLVLGFGSEALSDDGLPVKLVQDLKTLFSEDRFEFSDSPVGGMELLELLEGYGQAILIDTQMTSRRNPGVILEFTPENFQETFHLSSQHDLSFQDALQLAKLMEIEIPSQILILAIEIQENKILSFELSDPIQSKYPSILSYLCRILNQVSGKSAE